ncbi:efflux RND transporter periplasmic adaptor subunit [Pseudidiomarina mangrovi]|uniref:efflux RND transporter periplasmic adaptor subunit n=1 Tax=Pseudidiomarina mangrovi TaxID=2487133 RepID=UPI000FC9B13B|nr:efflux RND transporter periplasmic adaptor subunit [Pseudidiomarina mangrovi]CAI8158660.1 MAG: Multidrug resistance protein MexA [Pseudidiomarina mangrovi]
MRQRPFAALSLAFATTFWLAACGQAEHTSDGMNTGAPQSVGVVTLTPQSVPVSTTLPGRVTAFKVAEVRPQVSGILRQQRFVEGSLVQQGEPLYQLDPALFEAELAAAQASLASAEAVLQANAARYERSKGLLEEKAISQQDYDEAEANFLSAQANQQVAQAALQKAQLNLDYSRVAAPISGRIGRSSVTVGALIQVGQAQALTSIHQLDPIYVDIVQSSDEFMRLQQAARSGRLSTDSEQGPRVTITLDSAGEQQLTGTLLFNEVTVDSDTSSITLRAQFDNADQWLLPGMYVRAELAAGELQQTLLVPQQGVTRDARGRPTAMVVNAQGEVEMRYLTLGNTYNANWIVLDGLSAGDQVIVEGLQKIQPGAKVTAEEVK